MRVTRIVRRFNGGGRRVQLPTRCPRFAGVNDRPGAVRWRWKSHHGTCFHILPAVSPGYDMLAWRTCGFAFTSFAALLGVSPSILPAYLRSAFWNFPAYLFYLGGMVTDMLSLPSIPW